MGWKCPMSWQWEKRLRLLRHTCSMKPAATRILIQLNTCTVTIRQRTRDSAPSFAFHWFWSAPADPMTSQMLAWITTSQWFTSEPTWSGRSVTASLYRIVRKETRNRIRSKILPHLKYKMVLIGRFMNGCEPLIVIFIPCKWDYHRIRSVFSIWRNHEHDFAHTVSLCRERNSKGFFLWDYRRENINFDGWIQNNVFVFHLGWTLGVYTLKNGKVVQSVDVQCHRSMIRCAGCGS